MLVLVLVLDDPAIGDANGALDQGCLQAAVYLYSSPFKYLWAIFRPTSSPKSWFMSVKGVYRTVCCVE